MPSPPVLLGLLYMKTLIIIVNQNIDIFYPINSFLDSWAFLTILNFLFDFLYFSFLDSATYILTIIFFTPWIGAISKQLTFHDIFSYFGGNKRVQGTFNRYNLYSVTQHELSNKPWNFNVKSENSWKSDFLSPKPIFLSSISNLKSGPKNDHHQG